MLHRLEYAKEVQKFRVSHNILHVFVVALFKHFTGFPVFQENKYFPD